MSTSHRHVALGRVTSAVLRACGTLVLLALVGSVLTPTPAHAAAHESTDNRRDVVVQGGAAPGALAPARRNGDVASVRVSHGTRAVTLELRFRALRAAGTWHRHWFRMVTDEGVRRELAVNASPGAWQGRARLTGVDGSSEACELRSSIGYGSDPVVRVVVPRRCLSGPTWVRVAAGSVTATAHATYADDARTNGRIYDAPVFGPRVSRG